MLIILHSEIEAALMADYLEVSDLPTAWAEKMRAYLAAEVPNYTLGVLQSALVAWLDRFPPDLYDRQYHVVAIFRQSAAIERRGHGAGD